MVIDNPLLVARNYTQAIEEVGLDINQSESYLLESIQTVLGSATSYKTFENTLLEGLLENASILEEDAVRGLLNRQRQVLLEDTTVMASPEAMSFAVASFPMLIDIYAEPMLSKVITVYPYDKSILTIPRVKWIAISVDEYGATTEYEYPTATKNLRLNVKTVLMKQNDNVYTGLQRVAPAGSPLLTPAEFRISNRNLRISKIKYSVDDGNGNVTPQVADTFGIIDAKGNFFLDDVQIGSRTFRVQGNFVVATGRFTWGVTDLTPTSIASTLTDSVIFDELEFQFKLFGNGINKAVMRTKPLMTTVEVNCDLEESWEISEIEEVLQDWKSLWNMDILTLLKDHIKEQMKLNKDAEIADLLYGNIPAAKKYGMYREFDLKAFMAGAIGSSTRPTNVMDIFKNIYPIFIDLIDQMRKRIKMEPKYIVCGTKAGSVLKSLQQFETSLLGQVGEIGQVKGTPAINKFEIIVSDAVEEDLIYLIVKNEQFNLSTILEVTYKPLYVIIETTNSKRRTFIKSRGWIGIVRNEGIATIKVKNFNEFFGITA
jgi:hypothetical protein